MIKIFFYNCLLIDNEFVNLQPFLTIAKKGWPIAQLVLTKLCLSAY